MGLKKIVNSERNFCSSILISMEHIFKRKATEKAFHVKNFKVIDFPKMSKNKAHFIQNTGLLSCLSFFEK